MGQHAQTILVRPARFDGNADALLGDLGFSKRRKIAGSVPLGQVGCSIWIGSADDCLVMDTDFAASIFERDRDADAELAAFQDALFRRFPDADIAAVTLNSVVGAWGFAVYRGCQTIRRQFGFDGETFIDEGPRLPVELAHIARLTPVGSEDGLRYRDPAHPGTDDMSEADLGEALALEVYRSVSGFDFGSRKMHSIHGAAFWLNDDEARAAEMARKRSTAPRRAWWKFWQ